MEAAGRVCTGFSYPCVALYACAGDTVTYSNGMDLARGVSVQISPETSDNNDFYANNEVAETDSGVFVRGTATLEVDGMKGSASRMVYGLPDPEDVQIGESKVKVTKYSAEANPPYVGIGVVVRYRSRGVTTYVPTILRKAKFQIGETSAQTQDSENINWQTSTETATLLRDDTSKHEWKWEVEEQTSEEAAYDILKKLLSFPAEAAE